MGCDSLQHRPSRIGDIIRDRFAHPTRFRATPIWLRLARLAFGVLIVFTVIANYRQTTDTLGNFLSFFTIQSNIFGAIILLLGATTLVPQTERWD